MESGVPTLSRKALVNSAQLSESSRQDDLVRPSDVLAELAEKLAEPPLSQHVLQDPQVNVLADNG
jgi:hypothetical protein